MYRPHNVISNSVTLVTSKGSDQAAVKCSLKALDKRE